MAAWVPVGHGSGVRKGQLIDELIEVSRAMAGLWAQHLVALAELARIADADADADAGAETASGAEATGCADAHVDADASGVSVRVAGFSAAKRRECERRSVVAEVACALRVPESTVTRQMGDAETLIGELPETLAALRAGGVSYRHAQVMVSHTDSLPPEARAGFEQQVLPEALALTAAKFNGRARKVRERAHPESMTVRAAAARSERCVRFEPAGDGMAYLHHFLPVVDAQRIDDALSRYARAARGPGETRTNTQLRSDALTDLILHREKMTDLAGATSAGATEGNISDADISDSDGPSADAAGRAGSSPHPTVIVTVPISTLLGTTDEPGELVGCGPIDAVTARELAANAPSLLRMITDPITGETLNLGRKRYRPRRNLQLALQLDDETCRFPACNRRASGCDIDHTIAWENGGETNPDNLAHLCPKHHHLKHETGWRVRQHEGRDLEWTSPTGRIYTTSPPRCECTGTAPIPGAGTGTRTSTGPSTGAGASAGAVAVAPSNAPNEGPVYDPPF